MKFKPNAATQAIYKVLGLVSALLFAQAVVAYGLAALIIIASSDGTNESGAMTLFVVYLISGTIFAGVAEFLRTTRSDMLDKS